MNDSPDIHQIATEAAALSKKAKTILQAVGDHGPEIDAVDDLTNQAIKDPAGEVREHLGNLLVAIASWNDNHEYSYQTEDLRIAILPAREAVEAFIEAYPPPEAGTREVLGFNTSPTLEECSAKMAGFSEACTALEEQLEALETFQQMSQQLGTQGKRWAAKLVGGDGSSQSTESWVETGTGDTIRDSTPRKC